MPIIDGVTFKANKRMQQVCDKLGFKQKMSKDLRELVELELKL